MTPERSQMELRAPQSAPRTRPCGRLCERAMHNTPLAPSGSGELFETRKSTARRRIFQEDRNFRLQCTGDLFRAVNFDGFRAERRRDPRALAKHSRSRSCRRMSKLRRDRRNNCALLFCALHIFRSISVLAAVWRPR